MSNKACSLCHMVVAMLGIMTCQTLGWSILLGDSHSMTSWARGLLNLTMSMHREEWTTTMLFRILYFSFNRE